MLFPVDNTGGLLSPEINDQIKNQMMLSLGLGLLQNSGPSTVPRSFLQNLGQAGMGALSQGNSLRNNAIQQALQGRRLAFEQEKLKRGLNDPAGLREFEALTKGLSPEEKERAIRIHLGLEGRASSAGFDWQKVLGPDGRERLVMVDPRTGQVISEQDPNLTSPTITEKEGMQQAGEEAIKQSVQAFQQLPAVRKNINNYNEAIRLIDEGAGTGVVQSMLPSIRSASIQLDNMQGQLGLDVIGNTTFGALSENELKFALDTSLPTDLRGEELKKWLIRKREAQQKLHDYVEEAAIFLGTPGNTIADFLKMKKQEKPGQSPTPDDTGSGFKVLRVRDK